MFPREAPLGNEEEGEDAMSKSSVHRVICPACGAAGEAMVWESINAQISPALREDVINGRLFRYICPRCGHTFALRTDCFYHDMERRYLLHLCMSGNALAEQKFSEYFPPNRREQYTFRRIADSPAMAEKVHLLDEGFHDKVMELCKLVVERMVASTVANGHLKRLLFETVDTVGKRMIFVAVRENQPAARLLLPLSAYEQMHRQARRDGLLRESGTFEVIDRKWALSVAGTGHSAG